MLAPYVKGQQFKFLIFKRFFKFLNFFYSLYMKTDEIILDKCLAHNKYSVYIIYYHYDFCQRKIQRPKQLEKKKFYLKYKEVQPQNDQPAKYKPQYLKEMNTEFPRLPSFPLICS